MKRKLEERYGDRDLCWHVIVGKNFGGFYSFQEKLSCYFYIGQTGFLVFATVSRNYFSLKFKYLQINIILTDTNNILYKFISLKRAIAKILSLYRIKRFLHVFISIGFASALDRFFTI